MNKQFCYYGYMPTFFKQEKRQPFAYSAIETRRKKPNYSGWIVGGVLLAILGAISYMFLR